jgi:hypothetical protein
LEFLLGYRAKGRRQSVVMNTEIDRIFNHLAEIVTNRIKLTRGINVIFDFFDSLPSPSIVSASLAEVSE